MDKSLFKIQPLSKLELTENNGGWLIPFVVGAIAGGMLYDAWKGAIKHHINTMRETGGEAFIRGGR